LVEPAKEALAGVREVVFVPDRDIHLLPFSALVDPVTNRYLVEDYAVAVAPSANVYVRSLQQSGVDGERHSLSALVIGATEFNRSRFPSLARLPQAGKEAEFVAALYRRAQLLLGHNATRSRVLAEFALGPEVIHFAGHAVPNPNFPELSFLVLAPEPGKNESGAVYYHEVQRLRLGGTRIVILSACDTAAFGLSESEGPVGLARPFLAAGVSSVLASLAPVDDEHSRKVLTRFHLRLQAGDSPAEALRQAQLSLIAERGSEAHPRNWAFFELIGGAPI
jgi:CHAT domain-containing protein